MADGQRTGIYRGAVVDLGLETTRLPNGELLNLEIVRHPGGAAIINQLVEAKDLNWTVTRPNYMMGESLSKQPLISCVNQLPPIHSFILIFADVGCWTVAVTQDERLVHKFPAPEKALSLDI